MADYARQESDKMLRSLEKNISKEYSKAAKEMQGKLDKYLADFARKDKDKLNDLAKGLITKKEYNNWRIAQMAMGQNWEQQIRELRTVINNADRAAAAMMGDHVKDVYAFNHNYAAYSIEKGMMADLSFKLYDRSTVNRILRDNPRMLPDPGKRVAANIASGKAVRWSNRQIQSTMIQGILQGESLSKRAMRMRNTLGETFTIDDIRKANEKTAKQIARELERKNRSAAIRNARTMTTTAESAGRIDTYLEAQDMGIEMEQMWIATLDNHTRDSHAEIDGETIKVGETFSNGLEYPGDLNGDPAEYWNCRCTIGAVIPDTNLANLGIEGVERNSRLGNMSYQEWKKRKSKGA